MKRILFMLAGLLFMFASCSDGGSDSPETPNPQPQPEANASITFDSDITSSGLVFDEQGGEKSVSFTTNKDWTLSIAATTRGTSWCTASEESGSKGDVTIKFTVTENTEIEDRSVAVTIKAGTASQTFKIAQKGVDALLVTTSTFEVPQEGGTIDVEVKANIDYQLEIAETAKGWISEATSRALTAKKHSFAIAVNEESEKREGEIYIKSGDKLETVKVYQAGGALILLSQNEYTVSDAGETITVDVKSNVEYGVQMPEVDWIIDEASARGMSSHTLQYTILPNETYDNRSAEIIFYDKNSDLKETLTITQVQMDAIILSQKEINVAKEGETIEVKVNTNVDFEVQIPSDATWITQTDSRALTEKSIYLKIAENASEGNRSANITITNQDNQLSETITITQQGNIFVVTLKEAGTLENVLGKDCLDIVSLKVIGAINGTDVKTLRKMMSGDNYNLTHLDLSEASIVEGGDYYYIDNMQTKHYTTNNTISRYFFYKCRHLTSISLPNNITSIEGNAFHSASSLTSIVVPDSVTSIDYFAFYNCKNLNSIKIGKGVTSIAESAFSGCTSLTSIVIPDNVTSIGSGVFGDCSALQSISIGKRVTSIGGVAFQGCSALQSIIIPDNVTSIGERLFNGCSALSSIEFGDGITSIDNLDFSQLSSLNSVIIGNGITSIGNYAFANCFFLTSIAVGNGVTSIGNNAFYECSALQDIVIPDNVTSIGTDVFSNCYSLHSVTIGKGITSISENAFYRCSALKDIVIPDKVTSIGEKAFYGCSALKGIVIPDKVVSIGEETFSGCTSLSAATIGKGVTSIGEKAFEGCSALKSIIIPDKVTSIGERSFSFCSALSVITIDKGLISIGREAFLGSNLESIYITDLAAWCNIEFKESTPNSCDSNPLKGGKLYINNEEVTDLIIPNDINDIKKFSFIGCKSIKSVKIHDNVISIDKGAFKNCSSLTSVTIGKGVAAIGSNAFSYSSINEFYCGSATPPGLSNSYWVENYGMAYDPIYHTFYSGVNENATLYIPLGRKTAYEDSEWSNYFKDIVEMD